MNTCDEYQRLVLNFSIYTDGLQKVTRDNKDVTNDSFVYAYYYLMQNELNHENISSVKLFNHYGVPEGVPKVFHLKVERPENRTQLQMKQ